MRIGIYDENRQYISRVCEIMNEKYPKDMELVPLSNLELGGLNRASFDVLLINSDNASQINYGENGHQTAKIPVVYLSEEQGQVIRDDKVYIYKYQNVKEFREAIMNALTSVIRLRDELEKREREQQARQEAERREQERIEAERRERERIEAERREQERIEAERRESERIEAEKREQERIEAERRERERIEKEQEIQEQKAAALIEEVDLSGINTRIIAYMSLGGGMGSSTVAAGTAAFFAKTGKKVLYINLKPFHGTGYLGTKGENVSIKDMIEDIQSGCVNVTALFSNICISPAGVYLLDNFKKYYEMNQLHKSILAKMMLQADQVGKFDVVIFDICAAWEPWAQSILEISHKICMVVDGSEICNMKIRNVVNFMNENNGYFWQKAAVIYNKYKTMPKVDKYVEPKVMGGIGYMESQKPQDVINRMLNMKFLNNLIK